MINQKNTAIFIPARLAATRLPNKPLELIDNQQMIIHVWKRAIESSLGKVVVATDSEEIAKLIKDEGANIYDLFKYKNVIMTSSSAKKIQERVLNEKN